MGPGRGVFGSFGAVQKRCCREGFGGFGGPRAGCVRQFIFRPDALPRRVWRVRWAEGGVCPAVRCGAVHRGAAAKGLERSQFRGGTKEVLPRRVWSVRWAQGGVCPAVSRRYKRGAAAKGWRVRWAQGGVCPAVAERYNRGAAAKGLERPVGPGRGVSGSFGAVSCGARGGAPERLQGWQAECYGSGSNRGIDREKLRSTPKVVPGAAPAMARAGVGGYIHKCIYIYVYIYMYICIYVYFYIIPI